MCIFCHPAKEKSHRVHRTVVSSAVEQVFNETAMHAKATASNHLAKANRASHGPRVRAKERLKRVREHPKENPKVPKGAKGSYKGKTSKTGLSCLENPKSETSSETQESAPTLTLTTRTLAIPGVMMAWNDDWSSGGWYDGWEQTYDNSANSLSLRRFFTRCNK